MRDNFDIVVIGAGAAGLAAGRRLADAKADFVILEARNRLGGRGWTLNEPGGYPLDMGCGWLHSANHNIWREKAEPLGFHVEQAPAPWTRQSGAQGFTQDEQNQFGETFAAFQERIDANAENDGANAASFYLEPGNRWNPLLDAVFTYISGATLDCIDARDYARYDDTGLNWRVREGYGALIAAYGADLPVMLETPVQEIDHSGARIAITTPRGIIHTRKVIVSIPTTMLLRLKLAPDIPRVREAAEVLPLGHAEKLYFAVSEPEEFPADGHLFGGLTRVDTGSYHLRPLGRPIIECYFGAELAQRLAEAGPAAMIDFATEELTDLVGSSMRHRLTPLESSAWTRDPFALGSYSYAKPGFAEARASLAQSHENTLFFAGEACSRAHYSTAHGAFETGLVAAEAVLAAIATENVT